MKIQNYLKIYFPIIVSAGLLAQSFTIPVLSPFAFVFLIPFFYQLYKVSLQNFWKPALAFSLSFWLSLVYWLYIFHPLALPLTLLLQCFYFLIFAFSAKFIISVFPKLRIILIPVLWVVMEYAESLGFLGFPWGTIAVTQHSFLPFIQIADIFGVWGVSFAVVFTNTALLEIFLFYKKKSRKHVKYLILTLAAAWLIILSYGFFQIQKPLQTSDLKIGMIQGNINPNFSWNRIQYNALSRMRVLSFLASKEHPDLLVFWETAVMDYLRYHLKYEKEASNPNFQRAVRFDKLILKLASANHAPVIMGIPDVIQKNGQYQFYNAAVMINTNEQIINQYNKMHLVPFGEWFPFKNTFPFIRKMLDSVNAGDYTPGTNYTLFTIKDKQFGTLICYEGIFGYLARNFILKGADFFINITDDMWSFNHQAELQHRNADVFRAVENHVPFLRSGNSGATCMITPAGKIEKKLPLFTPDVLVVSPHFRAESHKTVYTKYGDWFPELLLIITLAVIITAVIRKQYRKKL